VIGLSENGVRKIIDPIVKVLAFIGLKIKYLVTGFGQGTESNFSSSTVLRE